MKNCVQQRTFLSAQIGGDQQLEASATVQRGVHAQVAAQTSDQSPASISDYILRVVRGCGARLCAKHQPRRTNTPNAWICAHVLPLVETTQPRFEANENGWQFTVGLRQIRFSLGKSMGLACL